MILKKIILIVFILFSFSTIKASIVITNGLTHSYKLKEGSVQKGIITIENTSNVLQTVKLYQQDYRYDATGASFYEDFGSNDRSNLQWIKLSTNLIRIEPKSKVNVSYEITVPDKVISGSSWSVVMIEPIDDVLPNDDKQGIQIKTVVRYSIQIVTTTVESAKAILNFDSINLKKIDGKTFLELALSNTGEMYHVVETTTEIFDSKTGSNKGKFKSDKQSLLPNNSKIFTIDLSQVASGNYNATILAKTNEDDVFGINIELEIPNE